MSACMGTPGRCWPRSASDASTPHYLVDAVVRTEATYQPAPSEDDLVAFDHVIRRLNALLPADEPGPA